MKDERIRVEMIRMSHNYVPCIKVDYLDMDAKEHVGVMVMDSGSNENTLCIETVERCMLSKADDTTTHLHVASNEVVDAENVMFSFAFGGHQFHEKLCYCKGMHEIPVGDMPIIGILGNKFMQKYGLVIDYLDGSLHSSEVNPCNLAISDCEFFFPMEIGLSNYGLPVVDIRQNGNDIAMVADTGATNNAIAKQSLDEYAFSHSALESKSEVNGMVGNSVVADEAMVDFNLVTLKEKEHSEISFNEHFMVLPYYIIPSVKIENGDYKGEYLPPVEGIISSAFMAKHGWILDFGAKIIYKLKEPLKEAV